MSEADRKEQRDLENRAFLQQLREESGIFSQDASHNDDTIGASNAREASSSQRSRGGSLSLKELFEEPSDHKQAEETIDSATSSQPLPSNLPPPRFTGIRKPPSVKNHGRGVSWGDGVGTPPPHVPSSPGSPSRWSDESARGQSRRLLNLQDVMEASPFEQEVETALLKAIDGRRHEIEQRQRKDSFASTILSPPSLDSSSGVHDMLVDNTPSSDSVDERCSTSQQEPAKETIPLVNTTRGHHRRRITVEDNLLELTEALARQQRTQPSGPPRVIAAPSTADQFAANGLLLAQHPQEEWSADHDTNAHGDKIPTGRTRWSMVAENLANLREMERMEEGGPGEEEEEAGGEVNRVNAANQEQSTDSTQSLHSSTKQTSNDASSNRKRYSAKLSGDRFKEDWQKWSEFFRPQRRLFLAYTKRVTLYLLLPMLVLAVALFYLLDGSSDDGAHDDSTKASVSYILLFCCRQIITLSLAFGMQGLVIDVLALNTRVLLRIIGPVVTLLVVQSKGWPHVLFWWSIFDFALVAGYSQFANHWLYAQNAMDVFNANNPSGQIPSNEWYLRCLSIAVSLSIVVSIKRFLIGLYLGRQQFSHYGMPLATVMRKMFLIGELANLSKHLSKSQTPLLAEETNWTRNLALDLQDGDTVTSIGSPSQRGEFMDKRDPITGTLHFSERIKLMSLLDQWEEPAHVSHASDAEASISAVLRFRKALTFIHDRYPFSYDFGEADHREACIESAQNVFAKLTKHSSTPELLQFETIALCALDTRGRLDQQKCKELVKLFRPDRQGCLKLIDFVKSVDSVYKEFRLLQATIHNASLIDRAFENIFNVVFYLLVFTIILAALDFDPLALFLSLSSVILAFAFMIGSASAKYFEGVLFILARRPYGIGDLISVKNVEHPGDLHGVMPWCVENVTLFETVVRFLPTNERASLSNGSLANCRIVNWARSPQAQFHIVLLFPLDTPYEKLVLFRAAVEEYMKARPREWRALNGFRANRVVANENFIEWLIVIQHREAWQQVGQVLDSKANLTSYCQEIARQLDMHYQAPRVPVDLNMMQGGDSEKNKSDSSYTLDSDALTQEFQNIAMKKHQIRVC